MKMQEGQGILAQLECANLWNVSAGKYFFKALLPNFL